MIKYETTGPERKIIEGHLIDSHGKSEEGYYFKGQFKNGVIPKGITTFFHSNGVLSFTGNVENELREGKGTSYTDQGKVLFKGLFNQGERFKGTLFNRGTEKVCWGI